MRLHLTFAALVGTLALAFCPAAAHAGTASVSGNAVQFNAGAAETNNVSVSKAGDTVTVTDTGAPLTPVGPKCAAVNPNTAACDASAALGVIVTLADGADSATITESVRFRNFNSAAIDGGPGPDELTYLGPEFAQLAGGAGDDTLTGGAGNSALNGGDDNDTLNGGEANDTLTGGTGNDTMRGGPGFDNFITAGVPDGADLIDGGPDRDVLSFFTRAAPLFVNQNGAPDDGEACPGPGCEGDNVATTVEFVQGGNAADTLIGGAGPNELFGSRGDDVVSGGSGPDTIVGGNDNDSLSGDAGDDVIDGDDGADTMSGGGGDDSFRNDTRDRDADVLSGGKGLDAAEYDDELSVRVSLDNRANDGVSDPLIGGPADNVRADVEGVLGGESADILIGNAAPNEFIGGGGNDRLIGKKGADGLIGGRGNDVLTGGGGRDTLDGEGGVDRLRSRGGGPDEVDCGASTDSVKADRSDRVAADCEKVRRR